jgi:hypothetical protein
MPWAAKDIMLWKTSTVTYWKNMSTMVQKAGELGMKMHLSITPTLSQFAIAANCTTRDLITNEAGQGRAMLKAYVDDMVTRFKDDPAVLTWGLGNELNLAADGCSYGGIPGQPSKADSFFSTAEMMSFSRDYISWIRALDPTRPIGSDMGKPRTRAMHLMTTPGGGEKCVNPMNVHGDCEVNCSVIPKDTLEDYKKYLTLVSEPFDMVSIHDYGCYPPFANYSFCDADEESIATLVASKEVADKLEKPLFVGEFGSPACQIEGWGSDACLAYPTALLKYQASAGVQLSNAWTWCANSGMAGNKCIEPRLNPSTSRFVQVLRETNRKLGR